MPTRTAHDPTVERLAFSVEETMVALGLSRGTLYSLINTGTLRTVKANGRRLVPRTAIDTYLEGGVHVPT